MPVVLPVVLPVVPPVVPLVVVASAMKRLPPMSAGSSSTRPDVVLPAMSAGMFASMFAGIVAQARHLGESGNVAFSWHSEG